MTIFIKPEKVSSGPWPDAFNHLVIIVNFIMQKKLINRLFSFYCKQLLGKKKFLGY